MKLATQISFGFLIAISIDLVDSFINYRLTLQVKANQELFSQSQAVIRYSHDLNNNMLAMENAFEGFLLTGDNRFLNSYYTDKNVISGTIREMKSMMLLSDQLVLLDSIAALHTTWINYSGYTIESRRKLLPGEVSVKWLSQFRNAQYWNKNNEYNIQMAGYFQRFREAEYGKRDRHKSALDAFIDRTDRFSLFFSILLVIVAAAIAMYLVRRLSARIKSMVQMAGRIANGDFGMVKDDINDELTNLTVSLNSMSAQLSRNISELEKKNVELNQFAYVVSHDLKAPARGISHVIQWIREDLVDEITPAMQKYLDFIPERIRRMEELIDGLLAYARAGREGAVWEQVDVNVLVGEIAQDVIYKPLSLQVSKLPVIYAQRLPLQQVFTNLIGNAVKFSRAMITVDYRELDVWYEFQVCDDGPGIAPEYHEKVFGLFQTLRQKDEKESTGIGLAIVRKIVEERGGTVRISSAPGCGAAFIFTWPKKTE